MIINNNIPALNTYRQMGVNQKGAQSAMEKLSSGLRINRAGDDAAGLAISEKMRGQIRGLDQASRNAQDGISMIQTAEGALNETHSILQRMRELAVQASNDTATVDDRKEIQKEVNQLIDEIDRIKDNTEFNTQTLLNGDISNKRIHIGSNEGQSIGVTFAAMGSANMGTAGALSATKEPTTLDFGTNGVDVTIGNTTIKIDEDFTGDAAGLASKLNAAFSNTEGVKVRAEGADLIFEGTSAFTVAAADNGGTGGAVAFGGASTAATGTTTGAAISTLKDDALDGTSGLQTQAGADAAITSIDNAIKTVSAERSKMGAVQNRLEHTISNLGNSAENLQAAESRIRDVDMAREVMEMTKNNILSQASQAMLAQANQAPQAVLQLLG